MVSLLLGQDLVDTTLAVPPQHATVAQLHVLSRLKLTSPTCLPPLLRQAPKKCGSCWSHAAIAAVESKLLIQGGAADNLSEQECVDCVSESDGCDGGRAYTCLQYMAERGVTDEASYPYTASQGQCQASKPTAAKLASPGYVRVQSESRDALLQVNRAGLGCCSLRAGRQGTSCWSVWGWALCAA